MVEGFALIALLAQQPVQLMTPLEHVTDPLKNALSGLTHAANQTCEVKAAIVDVKTALKDVAAGEAFFAQHREASALPALPPIETPDFTPPPRPAPRRNEMLEGALKDLETAFHRAAETPGADWGGSRDALYAHLNEGTKNLMTAIRNANEAFKHGRRDLPSCKPDQTY
jgi:hypothetical protein